MLDIKQLINKWQAHSLVDKEMYPLTINLPLKEVAELHALADLFPQHTVESILQELITSALDEMKAQLPYEKGEQIGEDENGDPIFEDKGLTPRLIELSHEHYEKLKERH